MRLLLNPTIWFSFQSLYRGRRISSSVYTSMDRGLRRSSRLSALTEKRPKKESGNKDESVRRMNRKKNSVPRKRKFYETAATTTPSDNNHINVEDSVGKQKHANLSAPLLLDIAPLVQGEVLRRPSANIRSPYVADVRILPDGPTVLAHAPALDVGGLCSPGSIVSMSIRSGGKTSHAIELVSSTTETKEGRTKDSVENDNTQKNENNTLNNSVLVGAHPRLGEILVEKILKLGLLQDVIGFGAAMDFVNESKAKSTKTKSSKTKQKSKEEKCSNLTDDCTDASALTFIRRQCTYGDSRVDFELSQPDKKALVEVKNVVCADYSSQDAPEKKGPNHCVIISSNSSEYRRSALFPWGRVNQTFEGQKVVSARAIKHIRNLVDTSLKQKKTGTNSNNEKTGKATIIEPIILFVVNRSDCHTMRACHEVCPVFAKELKNAEESGVKILAVRIRWTPSGQAYFDGLIDVNL